MIAFVQVQILVQPVSVSVGSSVMAPFLLYVVTALYLSRDKQLNKSSRWP